MFARRTRVSLTRLHLPGLHVLPRTTGGRDIRVRRFPATGDWRLATFFPRQSEPLIVEAPAGQNLLLALHGLDDRGRILNVERPHVPPVDRGHRRHVARAEALELADLHADELLLPGLAQDRVVHGL